MEITGRLTADAEVRSTKGNKDVVSFTVAVNDSYKTKDGKWEEVAEFISCSYWLSTKIADSLLKSSIVTVTGRLYLNEYTGKDGNKYANIAFHANTIKIIAKAKTTTAVAMPSAAPAGTPGTTDDLPF